jgi:pimeloyl-ACP methyl ester carboxylesterase
MFIPIKLLLGVRLWPAAFRLFRRSALFGAALLLSAASVPLPARAAEQAPAKPVIVFVHGAFGGGWQFKKVQRLLEARGYEVWRPTLTGLGERSHLAAASVGLETHIEDVVNFLRFEKLTDIVLVGHSYGGMVVTGVVDRVPERIRHVVYLDAFVPSDGDSVSSLVGSTVGFEKLEKNGLIVPPWGKPDAPYPHDVPHPAKTFRDVLSLKNPAAKKVPATYILTVQKGQRAEQDDFFRQSLHARERGWPVLQLEADHNPQQSTPEALADLIAAVR